MSERTYIAIDLKSFYAAVECRERGLDPMTTNLVVADEGRTEKTIGLAVSPSLKSFGIGGRPRLFEIVSRVKEVNNERRKKADGRLIGETCDYNEILRDPRVAVSYIVAPPRMALYMEYSARIYNIYLKYIAPEDIHVYSIDEVFIDATSYLGMYNLSARDLAKRMINDVFRTTGITATVGIGTNMYLCKVAMDIVAKKMPEDEDGVRIAELDEMSYRGTLWSHKPITDFWRVGRGYATKLEAYGIYTMGDVARCSVKYEELLYRLFGVNAELLIDHAWGYEPCTIKEIKSYKPEANSISSGQVLHVPYDYEKTKIIVREMTDVLVLDLVEKELVTDQLTLTVGYDIENLTNKDIASEYSGEVTTDRYGRKIPKHAHGTANLPTYTSSTKIIMDEMLKLFERIIDKKLLVRRINVTACRVIREDEAVRKNGSEQLDIFTDIEELCRDEKLEGMALEREKKAQHAILDIQKRYGKNAIVKGVSLEEGATTLKRNKQIGGHNA